MKEIHFKREKLFMWLGICFAVLLCVPYFILGKDSIITYHDQLDGELITYLLNAKHLFQKLNNYPEIMGGIPKEGMISPAPLYILFFKVFSPFGAFLCCILVNKLVQFIFIYLLLLKKTGRDYLSFAIAIWFTCIPFYPVYGLSIPGQPMLYYALELLREEDRNVQKKNGMFGPICLIFLYGVSSSLALCGFALLVLVGVWACCECIRGKRKGAARMMGGWILLTVTYTVCNLPLVQQLLPGGRDFISHKSEMKLESAAIWETFRRILLEGEDYCNAYSALVLPLIGVALVWGGIHLIKNKKFSPGNAAKSWQDPLKSCVGIFGVIILIALFRAVYQSAWIVDLRNGQRGVLHDFNFGRFTWLLPVLWCLCTAYAGEIILTSLEEKKLQRHIVLAVSGFLCLYMAGPIFMGLYKGELKPNAMKIIRGGNYEMMTWKQFYAEDLFEQVDDLIGRPKEEYHVVSLGIYPAAAAYNGFYCLDAYSNNYDLAYKHQFRKVIAPELDKSEYLKSWFDEWGNRCYLVLAQYNNYFTLEKRWGPYSEDYDLDFESLKELGGDYILSAAYLIGSEEKGLKLLNEEPIQTEGSWYRLWVYEIE